MEYLISDLSSSIPILQKISDGQKMSLPDFVNASPMLNHSHSFLDFGLLKESIEWLLYLRTQHSFLKKVSLSVATLRNIS